MTSLVDLTSPAFLADPYPSLARLRAEAPVHEVTDGVFLVSRHADVAALVRDPRLGRDLHAWRGYDVLRPFLAESPLERCVERWMFTLDGEEHRRVRLRFARSFSAPAVRSLAAEVGRIADDVLDALPDDRLDAVAAVAHPFTARVLSHVLGFDVDALRPWWEPVEVALEPYATGSARRAALDPLRALEARLRGLATPDDGEHVANLVLLLVAGPSTTASTLVNGLHALARDPAAYERLRRDRTLVPTAVEEMLRYDGPTHMNARAAYADVDVDGTTIPAGALVFTMLAAANRDPAAFAEPDTFDVGRRPNPHLAFGGGPHQCIGAPLARLQLRVLLDRIVERWRAVRLDECHAVRWRPLLNLRGCAELPITVETAA